MARKPSGKEQLDIALLLLKKAKTADELRTAQAIAFPLMFDLTIKQTAAAIGRSVSITCRMRKNTAPPLNVKKITPRSKQELRNRANASSEQEEKILNEVMSQAAKDSNASQLKPLIEAKLGKSISLSTVYNMLRRHELRKPVPIKKTPKIHQFSEDDWEQPGEGAEQESWDDSD